MNEDMNELIYGIYECINERYGEDVANVVYKVDTILCNHMYFDDVVEHEYEMIAQIFGEYWLEEFE